MSSVLENKGIVFFLSGGAGTGKTFVYNTISQKCRNLGHTVVSVASFGIVALLLTGGRTAHSTFSIPFNILDTSICGFGKQSQQSELFRPTKLIIWDEVPMQHRYCIEAVDRTLYDMLDAPFIFGEITMVFGGDFRQTLPVIPKGSREQIIGACLKRSYILTCIRALTLTTNMRLECNDLSNSAYDSFLNDVGRGASDLICIPSNILRFTELNLLLDSIYPGMFLPGTAMPSYLTEKSIVGAKNDDVASINAAALETFPGDTHTYLAADSILEHDNADSYIRNRYPYEFLNSLNPSGLPSFHLLLKVSCPIILLRNLASKCGLCNGTHLMVTKCLPHVIEVMILIGDQAGQLEFIPRISLAPSNTELPFQLIRHQFPVRLAYAMTINKAQGQSMKFVGIDLHNPVFGHDQAYVILSRCTSYSRVSLLLPRDNAGFTPNIVYPEVLN